MSYTLILAAPQFTEEDEKREASSLTVEEKSEAALDLYGGNMHQEEEDYTYRKNPAVIKELQDELQLIPPNEKPAFLEACKQRCEFTSDRDDLLLFLWSEKWNAKAAAHRLITYWEKRKAFFGTEELHLQLSAKTCSSQKAFHGCPVYSFLNDRDEQGRSILFIRPHNRPSTAKWNATLKALWCEVHDAIRSAARPKSLEIVCIVFGARMELRHFDRKLQVRFTESLRDFLPIRWVALHVCLMPKVLRVIKPVIYQVLGRDLRQRTVSHFGSEEAVLDSLETYGIGRNILPKDLGGDVGEKQA